MTTEKLLSQEEAAKKLGLASCTLRKWRWEGKGPQYAKLGARVFYRESDLQAYIGANIRSSTSEYSTYTSPE